jgi:ABC-type amino acid transport substrate-binding protein
MRLLSFLFVLCVTGGAAAQQPARTKVVVVTDSWTQLMYLDANKVPRGAMADFVNRMNEVQDKFAFDLRIYPRLRVDEAFEKKQADVYPLRTVAWTKPSSGLLATKTIFTSGDIYFARKDNRYGGRTVFDNLKSRSVAGVRGYHYELFDNNPDEAFIKKNFRASLLGSNEAVITFVRAGRADIGIVPELIALQYMTDPAFREQVIFGDFYDSRVEMSNLVRKDGPISVAEMNAIVELLVKSGDVARLAAKLSLQRYKPLKK